MLISRNRTLACQTIFALVIFSSAVRANLFGKAPDKKDADLFQRLTGDIEDCGCTIGKINAFNNVKIYPRLQSLLVRDYFRFYKVNLKRECPFWDDYSKCAIRDCHVKPCHDKDIPAGLKGAVHKSHSEESPIDKYRPEFQTSDCDYELGFLNTTISSENYKEFERWQRHDDALDNYCIIETDTGEYVDLLLNPERYTGYKGESANKIWRSIYLENCFRPDNSPNIFIPTSNINGMCLEKRAFFRAISGLHASINIHLCAKWMLSVEDDLSVMAATRWGPNLNEFIQRFSPRNTNEEGPNWLRNLYFLYLLELRALAKAAMYLEREKYYTGNDSEDADTRAAINDILRIIKSFPDHFNESVMFNGGLQARLLKEEFRQHFRNISRIMDCVGCEKCKLWGKLQTQGLGTALKILFSGKFDQWAPTLNQVSKKQFFLERSEIVALINAFGRLSESIFEVEQFRKQFR